MEKTPLSGGARSADSWGCWAPSGGAWRRGPGDRPGALIQAGVDAGHVAESDG